MKEPIHFKRAGILLLVLINAGSIITIHAQNAWEQMASMDIARGPASCVIDSMIYVFGGEPASVYASLDSADTYNTKTNEWSDLATMPNDLVAPGVEVINEKIYVLGGWQNTGGDNWATVNSVFEYDPAGNTWEVKNPFIQTTM